MSNEPKDVGCHVGGDYGLYTQNGELCEHFGTVEGAIENAVAAWHENCGNAEAFTIRTPDGVTVCTICPIGSDSCYVVRNNGDVMRWTEIHYVMGEDGLYSYTFAVNNGIEYKFKF